MKTPMMKCGHAAHAKDGDGNPCCVICHGISGGLNKIVDDSPPSLAGRTARCSYYGRTPRARSHEGPREKGCVRGAPCKCEEPSSPDLAFFSHKPDREHDEFYCGCFGWD